jgi:hypothetical protein
VVKFLAGMNAEFLMGEEQISEIDAAGVLIFNLCDPRNLRKK